MRNDIPKTHNVLSAQRYSFYVETFQGVLCWSQYRPCRNNHCEPLNRERKWTNGESEQSHTVSIGKNVSSCTIKYTSKVQKAINVHVRSSTNFTPFEIMFGVKMRNKNETDLIEILQDKLLAGLQNERNQMRMQAKVQIGMAQENYKRNYDRRRRGHLGYQLSDLVAIKVT